VPRKNHTTETRHLAAPIRDVEREDRCGSVAVVLSKCGFRGASSVTRLKASSVPGEDSLARGPTESSTGGDAMSARQ
jgi:hypothetical protein